MRRAAVAVTAFLAVANAGSALALDDGDKAAIHQTIERQIDAFRRDDAASAYAFAAPGIQRLIPSPDDFLAMVKQSYPPVYRPRSFVFGDERDRVTGVDQAVTVRDERGEEWLAVYSLAKQADGAWRITGCVLAKAPGTSI